MNWRKIDNWLFSPPHTFQTIFAFVTIRLSLMFESRTDADKKIEAETAEQSKEESRTD